VALRRVAPLLVAAVAALLSTRPWVTAAGAA
jgi:hypothetical protein